MADQTLIEGAYRAAQAEQPKGSLAASRAITGIGAAFGQIATGYLQQKTLQAKEYDVMAQRVIDEAGELSTQVKSELFDELQGGKNDYIWGDKKGKMLSIDNLNTQAKGYVKFMETRLNLADLTQDSVDNPDADGTLSNYFANSGEYDDYLKILEDNSKPIFKDGIAGFTIGGKWKSIDDINNTIKKDGLRDDGFQTGLTAVMDSYMEMSSKVMPGQNMPFPQASARNMVKNKLINKATNLKSVAYDNMFGDTSFYDDIRVGLQQGKYTDLGVEDPTGGTITPEDAEIMARTLINDPQYEGVFKNELTNYYTGFIQQNWNEGKEFRPDIKEGYRFIGGQYRQIDVLDDEDEFINNEGSQEEQEEIFNPFKNMNMELVDSVKTGDAELPVVNKGIISGSKKKVAGKLNETLKSYGFFVETGGVNEVLISHVSGENASFKVGGKVLGLGMESKKVDQVEDINEFINRVSQMQINWDNYNQTYGLEVEE